ncbi:MAG: LacI family DNA-binding transcriptional regulator [Candidatus Competibacteraceae bacterium]|nr:LacI family DNA-binding transcriptional regulator [Candidatus Competibacteraceae bacterium]
MQKKVGRIRDVARETGLSIATVSRVMNGATNVKPATREKVLNACDKLNYVPNPAARTLSTKRSRTIAAIIPTIEHSVFAKYITAIEQTLGERDYSLVLAISNANREAEVKAARQLLGMGAEAFILSGSDHHQVLLEMFGRRSVPYVFTSIWEPHNAGPTIGYDNYALATRAVEFLAAHGHERIAVFHGPLDESDRTRARRDGAMAATKGRLRLDFFETRLSVEGGKDAVRLMLAAGLQYSAVLCFSDVIALGTYFSLFERGIRVPADMSVMGFDNLDWSEHVVPPLTTIDLPAEKMGVEVATQLIENLETAKPIVPTLLAAEIIKRRSVRAINTK